MTTADELLKNPFGKPLPPSTPISRDGPRRLHAITVEIESDAYLAITAWPDRECENPVARLPQESPGRWMRLKAGDAIFLLDRTTKVWNKRVVKRIVLYLVHPVAFIGDEVVSALEWVEGG